MKIADSTRISQPLDRYHCRRFVCLYSPIEHKHTLACRTRSCIPMKHHTSGYWNWISINPYFFWINIQKYQHQKKYVLISHSFIFYPIWVEHNKHIIHQTKHSRWVNIFNKRNMGTRGSILHHVKGWSANIPHIIQYIFML